MSRAFTIQDLEKLKAAGTIKGFTEPVKKYSDKSLKNIPKKGSKIKGWIALNLLAWCEANKLTLKTELKFHPERKWKFDWCIEELKIGIEYEGLMSQKSRHTTVSGFTGDAEKYNAAQALGWKVLRYTALNYKTILSDLETTKNNP